MIDDDFPNHRLHSIIKIIVQTRIIRPTRPSFPSTIHVQLSMNLLPFQGVDGVCCYPPRCGGLACVALSGRKVAYLMRKTAHLLS
ncbi:MAG: hypothetical protein LBG58_01165 [Planctomycetaceae bacterium]|nr:hypothetical protein [Planctomycetaceae bacterium]